MADRRNANLPEVIRCQLRQHLPIDLVVAEGRHIALKAQTLQPRLYVHAVFLGSAERQLHLFQDIDLPVSLPGAGLKWTLHSEIEGSWLHQAMTAFAARALQVGQIGTRVPHSAPTYRLSWAKVGYGA